MRLRCIAVCRKESRMIEIKEHGAVTQIKLSAEMEGNPIYWVSAYLVDGLLIDTGSRHTSEELTAFLKTATVKKVINTHFHEDHIGGNKKIHDRFGVPVFAHKDSVPLIGEVPFLYPYQELAFGYPEPTVVAPVAGTVKTENYEFRIIETPGHCAGHIVLLEMNEGWCFSGDIFTRENIKFIRPEENIGMQIRSLKNLLSIAGERLVLFTALGRVIEDGKRAMDDAVNYLEDLHRKVKELSHRGKGPEDILIDIFGGEHPFSQITNGQFSSLNLVKSLLNVQ